MTSLSEKLLALEEAGTPIQVGLIGAGKFGSMFISQAHTTPGLRLVAVADLSIDRAYDAFHRTAFPNDKVDASRSMSISEGIAASKTVVTTDSKELISHPDIQVVVEATGSPSAGIAHALLCCEHKKHIVMVNVEADVLAGAYLAQKAQEAGILYSWAYGDQPALIAELVDWAQTSGFKVVCAGKGNKFLPEYNYSTPETVWQHWGFTKEQLAADNLNSQIYNSFLDGTKSALEMAAVVNGCRGLSCPETLNFPPCGYHDLARLLRPSAEGGQTEVYGTVEVTSSLERDGRDVLNHARHGVFVVFEGVTEYQRAAFKQYGLETDPSGRFAANYKPFHLIGLEVGVSIASIVCRGEPTGTTKSFEGDVVATAKRDLKAGEMLDGEGGYTVVGKLMPARRSLEIEGLPIGLAQGLRLKRDVRKDEGLSWRDVEFDGEGSQAVKVRGEMEKLWREKFAAQRKLAANGVGGAKSVNVVNGHASM